MTNPFFDHPIINSPYTVPTRHWELDEQGLPTQRMLETRRRAKFINPIPRPQKTSRPVQEALVLSDTEGVSSSAQQYDPTIINEVREKIDLWRALPNPQTWLVTPETARLLQHWRNFAFDDYRPFFCQVEAAETIIWLTEVAPKDPTCKKFIAHLTKTNADANPELFRLALKMATGAGKTTVMAMIIAWQTINAVRYPSNKMFTRGFLVVAPGLTIKDRLRVLHANDPNSYFTTRKLVPIDFLDEVRRAKIVITNYHAFKLRERIEIAKVGRRLLQGPSGEALNTLENEGQMIQRVMPELMGLKNIMVINDEAHHCYREKPDTDDDDADDEDLRGDEKKEAEENLEAARVWIAGLEAVNRKLGVTRVVDLSATPFFLSGSGYAEGTLFPWTMSDFSLMDAIECGIVKLPRVPVAENIATEAMPMYRNLWANIRADMPKKSRGTGAALDPLSLPVRLQTALEALYGHYEKVFNLWQAEGLKVPPCFIIVCNNTSTSKLVYDYVSGFLRTNADGSQQLLNGRLPLFRNFDGDSDRPLPRPRTLLIDSKQLESGEALGDDFRKMAGDEIERFKRDMVERTGDARTADQITDQELLREVMNTVGKAGQLGGDIRCVVSVSMLTEGWDANNVTHILGVRAFGTQLLCEQVIGRALRRQSYALNDEGLFDVEYADVFGIPFDFAANPVVAAPQKPREMVVVKAVRPDRDALEISFPRVMGYRVALPEEHLTARFTDDSTFVLDPNRVGATITRNEGVIGEGADMQLVHLAGTRTSTITMHLTKHLLTMFSEPGEPPKLHLFGQLKRITKQWLDNHLVCNGDTYPAQLCYLALANEACERIKAGITDAHKDERPIEVILDPYNPSGSTAHVRFNTASLDRWQTSSRHCHVNYVVWDSHWEAELCRLLEAHPQVRAYVKNHSLGFEVPYRMGGVNRTYLPDFIVLIDDGRGPDDLLRLVIEVKGYRKEDAKVKKQTMDTYWIPGVNNLGRFGRWAFAEFTDVFAMSKDLENVLSQKLNELIASAIAPVATEEA